MQNIVKARIGLVGALALVACSVARVNAAEHEGLNAALERANRNADATYQNYAAFWRQKIADVGSRSRLRRMASDVAAFDEKLAQGIDLFSSDSTPKKDRMRESFRRNVVDERELVQAMVQSFVKFQEELAKESIDLYVRAGVERKLATELFRPRGMDGTPWLDDFDSLIAKAKALAREDWWRVGAITVGSGVAVDQAMQSKEPSWGSFFMGLIAQAAAETALEYATDPTDRFAKKLVGEFNKAEQSLLHGKQGLLVAMRGLTELHKQIRNRHFSIVTKGGK